MIYELKICFDYYKERIALKYWAMGKKLGNFILELNNIKKSFGNTEVLKGISLSVKQGEFITFLGSSGCGKTTTLRVS